MLTLPMINTVKLISVTTLFVTAFIATALLIYGASGASACPHDWTRDAYGNCSIRMGKNKPDAPASHATPVSVQDPKVLEQRKIAIAAETGDAGAQRELGIQYLEAEGSNASRKKGLHWLKRAAAQGDTASMRVLGLYNLKRNADQLAFDWFKRAADIGDPRAAYFTATMLRYSPRIRKDETLAYDYYLKSARAGHPNSQYEIGRYYTNGRGPVQGNFETAAGWYKKAADQNNAEAQNMLSLMYSDGLGIEQDMRQARLLSEAAVKNGLKGGIAETNLGWWYLTGESGHPKDLQLAHEWNRRGASAGHANASANLALIYAAGLGRNRDITTSLYWLRKSAEDFSHELSWVLDNPDEWDEYDIPEVMKKARQHYWAYLKNGKRSELKALKNICAGDC